MARGAMLCGAAAVAAFLAASPAWSDSQKANFDAPQEFQIPGQALDTALLLYSRESGLQIISYAPAVANKVAPPLHGKMTPRQALNTLLKGSELSFVVSGSTITIVPRSATRASPIVPIATQSREGAPPAALLDGDPPPAAAPTPAKPAAGATQVNEVTVTGSRLIRNGYQAPTPVVVVPAEEVALTSPFSISDALSKLPEFTNSLTQNSNGNSTTGVSGSFLNLRGLGADRTLVLMDGNRIPPTSYNGTVDVNTLPQMLLQRVEVVTGGASAIYGSDAVGGVVNFILDTKFTGFKAQAESGISTYGDGPSQKFGFAVGAPAFGGAGHVLFSYEHSSESGLDQSDRSFAASDPGYTGAGTAASPYTLQNDLRLATTTFGGYITSGKLKGDQFVGSGTLAPFTPGAATASPTLQVGGQGAYYYGMQMFKPLQTDQLFGRFDYDLGHNISAYIQVSAGSAETSFASNSSVVSTTIYGNNPFLPASAQAIVGPTGSFTMNSLLQNLALMGSVQQQTQNLAVATGLQGKFLNDRFSWDVYYAHGDGSTHSTTIDNINSSHFYAALDAVQGPNGVECGVSKTAYASLYPGCAPLDIFGVGNKSTAALNYIFQDTSWQAENKMDDVSGTIRGSAFNDWAGPVSLASTFEYRAMSLSETTDANPDNPPTLTGLLPTWAAGGLKSSSSGPTQPFLYGTEAAMSGSESVWEINLEALVPLLKDLPLAKSIDFDGTIRYTDYSTTGEAITWKVGGIYQPISDVRIRVSESHDIRAPSLYEMFQSPAYSTDTITDPHTGVTGNVEAENVGNPNLKPEVADTFSTGVIYSPSWLPRFRISADYYYINIQNVISTMLGLGGSPNNALTTCQNSGGTSEYCQAIIRPYPFSNTTAQNFPSLILDESVNLSRQYNQGIDLESSYAFALAQIRQGLPGRVDLRTIFNYSPEQVVITNPGATPINAAGNGISTTKATLMLNYELGAFKASWQTTYTGPHHQGTDALDVFYAGGDYPALLISDLGLSYRFKAHGRNLQAFMTVNNIFNQSPQISPLAPTSSPGQTSPAVGDSRGRYFTGGVKFAF